MPTQNHVDDSFLTKANKKLLNQLIDKVAQAASRMGDTFGEEERKAYYNEKVKELSATWHTQDEFTKARKDATNEDKANEANTAVRWALQSEIEKEDVTYMTKKGDRTVTNRLDRTGMYSMSYSAGKDTAENHLSSVNYHYSPSINSNSHNIENMARIFINGKSEEDRTIVGVKDGKLYMYNASTKFEDNDGKYTKFSAELQETLKDAMLRGLSGEEKRLVEKIGNQIGDSWKSDNEIGDKEMYEMQRTLKDLRTEVQKDLKTSVGK